MQAGAALLLAAAMLSSWLAPTPGWEWRLLGAASATALAWHPLRSILFQGGRAAVRWFEWRPDGAWFVLDHTGARVPVQLDPASAAFGPWILLVWHARKLPGTHGRRRGRHYALIDGATVSARRFRALRGRLRLTVRAP